MAELVQQHAQKQEQDEQKAAPSRLRSPVEVFHPENPGEQQHKGDVDAYRRAGN
jgi:hypothetical protein